MNNQIQNIVDELRSPVQQVPTSTGTNEPDLVQSTLQGNRQIPTGVPFSIPQTEVKPVPVERPNISIRTPGDLYSAVMKSPEYSQLDDESKKTVLKRLTITKVNPWLVRMGQKEIDPELAIAGIVDPIKAPEVNPIARGLVAGGEKAGDLLKNVYKISDANWMPKLVDKMFQGAGWMMGGKIQEAANKMVASHEKQYDIIDKIVGYPSKSAKEFFDSYGEAPTFSRAWWSEAAVGQGFQALEFFTAGKLLRSIPAMEAMSKGGFVQKVLFNTVDSVLAGQMSRSDHSPESIGTDAGVGAAVGALHLPTTYKSFRKLWSATFATFGVDGAKTILKDAAVNASSGKNVHVILNELLDNKDISPENINNIPQVKLIYDTSKAISKYHDEIAQELYGKNFSELGKTEQIATLEKLKQFAEQSIAAPDKDVAEAISKEEIENAAKVSPTATKWNQLVTQLATKAGVKTPVERAAEEASKQAGRADIAAGVNNSDTVPEAVSSIKAQFASMLDGKKTKIFIPNSTQINTSDIPKTTASGQRIKMITRKSGIVFYVEGAIKQAKAELERAAVEGDSKAIANIIDAPQTKEEIATSAEPIVITKAEDINGKEISTIASTVSRSEEVIKKMEEQFPQAKIKVGTEKLADDILEERRQSGSDLMNLVDDTVDTTRNKEQAKVLQQYLVENNKTKVTDLVPDWQQTAAKEAAKATPLNENMKEILKATPEQKEISAVLFKDARSLFGNKNAEAYLRHALAANGMGSTKNVTRETLDEVRQTMLRQKINTSTFFQLDENSNIFSDKLRGDLNGTPVKIQAKKILNLADNFNPNFIHQVRIKYPELASDANVMKAFNIIPDEEKNHVLGDMGYDFILRDDQPTGMLFRIDGRGQIEKLGETEANTVLERAKAGNYADDKLAEQLKKSIALIEEQKSALAKSDNPLETFKQREAEKKAGLQTYSGPIKKFTASGKEIPAEEATTKVRKKGLTNLEMVRQIKDSVDAPEEEINRLITSLQNNNIPKGQIIDIVVKNLQKRIK